MKKEFEPLKPCFVGNVRVKALASGEKGEGWCSPCPQLYIGDEVFVGYTNIKELRDMCVHALLNVTWDNPKEDS